MSQANRYLSRSEAREDVVIRIAASLTTRCVWSSGRTLTVRTDAVTMAEVWVGNIDLAGALRSLRIALEGPSHLRRAFPRWLVLSKLTEVKRQTERL